MEINRSFLNDKKEQLEVVFLRLILLFSNFLAIPLILANVGTETYSLIAFAVLVSSIFSLFEFGVSNSVVSMISGDLQLKNESSKKTLSNVMFLLSMFSIIVMFLGFFMAKYIPWDSVFGIQNDNLDVFRYLVFIAVISSGLGIFLSLCLKILLGTLNTRLYQRWLFASSILSLGLQVYFSDKPEQLVGIVFSALFFPQIVLVINHVIVSRKFSLNLFDLSLLSLSEIKVILKIGSVFFVSQILWFINYHSDVFLIGNMLSARDVSTFVITWKVFSVPIPILSAIVLPLWPKISQLYSSGKRMDIYTLFAKYEKKLFMLVIPFCLILCVTGNNLIRIWTSNLINPSISLVISMAIWVFLSSVMLPVTMLLYGIGDWKFLQLFSITYAVLSFFLGALFIRLTENPAGVIWAKSLVVLVCLFIPLAQKLTKWKLHD